MLSSVSACLETIFANNFDNNYYCYSTDTIRERLWSYDAVTKIIIIPTRWKLWNGRENVKLHILRICLTRCYGTHELGFTSIFVQFVYLTLTGRYRMTE